MKGFIWGSWFYRFLNILLTILLVFSLSPQIVNPAPAKAEPAVPIPQELLSGTLTLREINPSFEVPPQQATTTYILNMAVNGDGVTNPPAGSTRAYTAGTSVSISARASQGYIFANWTWTGGGSPIANPISASTTVTMNSSRTVTANFQPQPLQTQQITGGKINPYLNELLKSKREDEKVKVGIWFLSNEQQEVDAVLKKYPDVKLTGRRPGKNTDKNLYKQIYEEMNEARRKAIRASQSPVLQFIQSRGYNIVYKTEAAPIIFIEAPKSFIYELAQRPGIDTIYPDLAYKNASDVSVPTIGATTVWSYGMTGSGVRTATIEDGGGIFYQHNSITDTDLGVATSNYYVPGVATSSHATMVAGIISSTDYQSLGYKGVAYGAPSILIGNAPATTPYIIAETLWAINLGPNASNQWVGSDNQAWIINASISFLGESSIQLIDRFFDYIVSNYWKTIVVAAGNTGDTSDYWVKSPGLGYNIITVGGFDDKNTISWSDDIMTATSSYGVNGDPDRQKPEVVAPSVNIKTTSYNPYNPGDYNYYEEGKWGTSWAAPHVTGLAALLIDRSTDGWIKQYPEIIKAAIMASAIHNIEGSSRLSQKDGAGAIYAPLADKIVNEGQWDDFDVTSSFTSHYTTAAFLKGERVRVVASWDIPTFSTSPYLYQYDGINSVNLDLEVSDPDGATVAYSRSTKNNYEIVDFISNKTGVFTIRTYKQQIASGISTYAVLAWAVAPPYYALNFDGVDDYVQVTATSSLNITGAITIAAWAKDPPPPAQKVTDPAKQVKDSHTRKILQDQGIDPDYVELSKDYGRRSEGKSPYGRTYKDLQSGKFILETSGLPMVDANGLAIEAGWNLQGNVYIEKNNLFRATVAWNNVELRVKNNQPDGRKTNDRLNFRAQLFLNGIEQTPTGPALLAIDPVNSSYRNNVLEWDYGIAKRRLRLIEGRVLGSWIFAANPGGDVRMKYNQAGDFKLKLGRFKANDEEEFIPRDVFDNPAKYDLSYPIKIGDTLTFYPNDSVVHTQDGLDNQNEPGGVTWATMIAASGNNAGDAFEESPIIRINNQNANENSWRNNYRSIFLFDTSPLTASANISAATLSLRGTAKLDNFTTRIEPNINIYVSNPASNTAIVAGDYARTGGASPTAFATAISYSSWNTAGYNDFALNASGIANISKTGVSKFSARNANYDVAGVEPAEPAENIDEARLNGYFSEYGGTGKPMLVVIYTVPDKTIISKGRDAYSLEMSTDGSTLYGYINYTTITATVATPLAWHHYALTYDGSSQKLYIDGSQVSSSALTVTIATNAYNLKIGDRFSGLIDEVRIYSRALSSSEITDLYNNIEPSVSGLQARYMMEEGSGGTIADDSGNNNTGTIYNGAIWSTRGSTGTNYALNFDGTNDYVGVGDTTTFKWLHGALAPASFTFTINLWVNVAALNTAYGLLSTGYGSSSGIGIDLYTISSNQSINLVIANGSSGQSVYQSATFPSNVVPAANQWFMLTLTHDMALSSDNLKIYTNGILKGTVTRVNTGISTSNSTNSLHMGSLGDESLFLNGKIDEVRIYNRVLSADEVYNLYYYYGYEPSTQGLKARYMMNEGSGSAIADDSGNNNTGTIYGATWVTGRP